VLNLRWDNLKTVLCLGAHADDIEIGCGGTILKLLAQCGPLDVHWVVLGAEGERTKEAIRSAELFLAGASSKNIVVHGFRDSYFPYLGGQIKECVEQLRDRISPDLIFTHRCDDLHQDHRLLCELTWCAFRNHLILEYEIPKYDGDLGRPNLYVSLNEAICREKIRLIVEAFATQRSKPWFSDDTYWSLMRLRGVECNSPSKYAEAFQARKAVVG
jgi:LmbE family N-acetylglucosaminyl deacetylase